MMETEGRFHMRAGMTGALRDMSKEQVCRHQGRRALKFDRLSGKEIFTMRGYRMSFCDSSACAYTRIMS